MGVDQAVRDVQVEDKGAAALRGLRLLHGSAARQRHAAARQIKLHRQVQLLNLVRNPVGDHNGGAFAFGRDHADVDARLAGEHGLGTLDPVHRQRRDLPRRRREI